MAYTIVDLEQGSEAWHAWRAGRYTASQAPSVMGVNPWFPRTPRELYRLRTGQQEVFVNQAMRRGNEMEPRARELLAKMGYQGLAAVCAEAEVAGMLMGASLDAVALLGTGDDTRRVGLEIKTPSKGSGSDLFKDNAAEHYVWQMAHQLTVVDDLDELQLAVYAHDTDEVRIAYVMTRADLQAFKRQLLDAWQAFDDCVANFREPAAGDADVLDITDDADELAQLAAEYSAVQAQLEQLETQAAELKEKIQSQAKARGGGCKVLLPTLQVYQQERAGNVNWKHKAIVAALAAAQVNPDDYRGKATTYWTLKARKVEA